MVLKKTKAPVDVAEFRGNIFKRPDFLDTLPQKGQKGKAIAMLSEKLKLCENSEAVIYPIQEFRDKFHAKGTLKKETTYIIVQLRLKHNHPSVRVHYN